MRTIKFLTGALFLSMMAGQVYAQVVNVKDVAKDDATSRTNSNIESGVDNSMGKAEGAIKGLFKKKKNTNTNNNNSNNSQVQTTAPTGGTGFKAYNNYDFVPGDNIIFADDFQSDQDGEFPAHWNLGAGQAVVNSMNGVKVFSITQGNYAHVSPLIKSASYLTDPFTIEFDSYALGDGQPHIYFYNSTAEATAASGDLGRAIIGDHNGWGGVEVSSTAGTVDLQGSFPADISGERYANKWHHIAIAYKNGQMKVYVDQYRILSVPNVGFVPHAIDIEGIGDPSSPVMIANFRLASGGGMNMLGKKFTDAKIITHGINFDIDQSTIKPESMGTLNMIKGVLNDNPDLKFEIDGHTDNSGISSHNLILSQQRADAVKNQLLNMGIDGSRLTTKGFGDSKPIGNNSTPEGKANNRRVEFVRM